MYPDRNNLTVHKNIGVYDSLESCRAEAIYTLSLLSRLNPDVRGDYECGLNCEYRDNLVSVKICKKTER